jgi:outer membrane protein OmpA-like peptidoglycan-associated protein
VFFDTGKATIQARSFGLLDDVAAAFAQNPDILKVEVAGHTDSQGADAANLTLSQKRADAVVAYLINKGIGPERLSPVGFGEGKPIASNETADGRAENRRVEFTILDQKEGGP